MKYKFILLKSVLLSLCIISFGNAYSQNNAKEIIIVYDSSSNEVHEKDSYVIMLLLKDSLGHYSEILKTRNYLSDFKYLCTFTDKYNDENIVFSNYSSPAGYTKLFYFNINENVLYSSFDFEETLRPQIFTFDKKNLQLHCTSFAITECGETSIWTMTLKWKKDHKSMHYKDLPKSFITIKKIMLPACQL